MKESNKRKSKKNKSIKRRNKIKKNHLGVLSNYAGGSIVFGGNKDKLNKIFNPNNGEKLKYLISFEKIGNVSRNGFLYMLHFKKDDYHVSRILKSSSNRNADNLFYEYFVGIHFINKLSRYLPCFVETYHLYRNTNEDNYHIMKDYEGSLIKEQFMSSLEIINNPDVDIYCTNPQYLSILIETVTSTLSFHDYINHYLEESEYDSESIVVKTFDLVYLEIMYQVYGPLSLLNDHFTHYDLHANNILLEYLGGKMMKMRYVYPDTIIEFNTQYIVKIIDYGRSFFKSLPNEINKNSSENFYYEYIHKHQRPCLNSGLNFLLNPKVKNFIQPMYRNYSHDLRLAKCTLDMIRNKSLMLTRFSKFLYYEGQFGTPEKGSNRTNVCNVMDYESLLRSEMRSSTYIRNSQLYSQSYEIIGTLTIYMDHSGKPIEYVEGS